MYAPRWRTVETHPGARRPSLASPRQDGPPAQDCGAEEADMLGGMGPSPPHDCLERRRDVPAPQRGGMEASGRDRISDPLPQAPNGSALDRAAQGAVSA